MLTKERCYEIAEQVKRISSADEVEVYISGGRSALTRFANNTIHQNVADENHAVSVRTVFNGRTARAIKIGLPARFWMSKDSLATCCGDSTLREKIATAFTPRSSNCASGGVTVFPSNPTANMAATAR